MIIGLTGSIAAGKGVVSEYFKDKGFVYLSLSDELREVAKERKIDFTRENLQNLGNLLREERGGGVLAKLVMEKIKNQRYEKAIVDGIRNPAELDELKKLKKFFLVSVDAPAEIRFERMVDRSRESDPISWSDFIEVDSRDKGIGESITGQGVAMCMDKAEFVLINDGSLEKIKGKIEELYEEIDRKMPRLSWDEYFVEIMEAVSKRATCNRGRSGCVIVKNKHILVTGYVGSPVGLPHCDEIGHQMKQMVHEDGHLSNHCVRTAHAEQNAICQAAKLGIPLEGSTLYCFMTPCAVCAKMIINSGIKRVVARKRYHAGAESEQMFGLAGVRLEHVYDELERYKGQ